MKSYLRFLSRNKLYTAIEVVGLSLALAFVLIIGSYVWQQYSVPRKVRDYDRIWSVGMDSMHYPRIGMYMGAANVMMENIPEIEMAGSYFNQHMNTITLGDTKKHVSGIGADMGFFRIFEPEFLVGSYEVLNVMSNAIVSESFAKANGGTEDIIGRRFVYNGFEFTIAAVMKDLSNSLFPYCDIVINIDSEVNSSRKNYKYICDTYPFLKVREGVERDMIIEKLDAEVERMGKEDIIFLPYDGSIILDYQELFFSEYAPALNSADRKSLWTMMLTVIILLVSAIINFINLNAAMSGKRIKEMATRMILGTDRKQIRTRYLFESMTLCLISGILAVLIAVSIEPYINNLVQSDIPITVSLSPVSIIAYVLIILFIGAISGIIPASIGTYFNPAYVLKGQTVKESKRAFSKVFIGVQNAVSLVLIALAITMELQMRHMADRPVGADIEDLYYLYIDNIRDCASLEKDLRELPFVEEIGISEGYPGKSSEVLKETEDGTLRFGMLRCDSTAFAMYGFKRIAQETGSIYNTVWMTQNSIDASGLDLESPEISGYLPGISNTRFGGIVADYAAFNVLKDYQDAICFIHVFSTEGFTPIMSEGGGLLLKTIGNHEENSKIIENTYRKYIEERNGIFTEPSEYGYIEDLHSSELDEVKNNIRIMELFMLLSIVLSFMGLVAMSTYFSSENTSEIAIRKIFGGTATKETISSVWKYMKIVLIACITAIPVAVYECGRYLEGFVYRIENRLWVYLVTMAIALMISFTAVFVQTLRAARTNPAEALKKE